ncbi:GNAT family acetyltransferase [Meiothermus sp.]|uniref:GNAT family acetyltransferase n=1 Tax=Meiothermus sp. TaxID=1955249 RepID=UPI0021DC8B05|nr:GNAT family acetyltransferase [Meiothermus sp.]GIW33489.1 MAG: GNAT family acetyltransferase [Meiothermus sp.]
MPIREFRMADYSSVMALWQDAGLELNPSDSFEGLQKKLERDPDLFLVVEEDGQILGALLAGYDGRRGWLYHMAIHPFGQGQGWGKRMMEELEARLRAKGCQKLNLLVEPSYSGAQDFFERLGYRRDELIFMEKWLGG